MDPLALDRRVSEMENRERERIAAMATLTEAVRGIATVQLQLQASVAALQTVATSMQSTALERERRAGVRRWAADLAVGVVGATVAVAGLAVSGALS